MSMFYAVRRAVPSVAPEAFRALKHHWFIHSALGSAFQNRCIHLARGSAFKNRCTKEIIKGTPWVSNRAATSVGYTKSNENLAKLLEDEIQCALVSDPTTEDAKPRGAIPWKIEDILDKQAVILRKKYSNEDIKVEVDPEDTGSDLYVNLTVTISKGEGPFLEFICTGYYDEVIIDAIAFKHPQKKTSDEGDRIPYEGPDFDDLNESLQNFFYKYLEMRGIVPSLTNCLCDLKNKERKENINWLIC